MSTTAKSRKVLVRLADGSSRIVENVPANAKITFGAVNPGAKGWGGGYALRIYTSQQNQLAVFLGVQEFRDLSLTVKKQVQNEDRKHSVTDDGKAVSIKDSANIESEWVVEEF